MNNEGCQLIVSDLHLWEPDHEFPWPLEVMNLMLYRMIRMILQELFATKGGGCLKIHKIGSSSSSSSSSSSTSNSSKFRGSMHDEPMSYL